MKLKFKLNDGRNVELPVIEDLGQGLFITAVSARHTKRSNLNGPFQITHRAGPVLTSGANIAQLREFHASIVRHDCVRNALANMLLANTQTEANNIWKRDTFVIDGELRRTYTEWCRSLVHTGNTYYRKG